MYSPSHVSRLQGQLQKLFFLYPDPHFKRVKCKWRVISPTLLDVYAYVLAPGSLLYCCTDVPELADWMATCLSHHTLFSAVHYVQLGAGDTTQLDASAPQPPQQLSPSAVVRTEESLDRVMTADSIVRLLVHGCTDEAAKARREGRGTTIMVFRRVETPAL